MFGGLTAGSQGYSPMTKRLAPACCSTPITRTIVASRPRDTRPGISSPRGVSRKILHQHEEENSREERYANAFARAFLTPARGLMQKFDEVTAGSDRLTRRHVIVLAHFYGVSREAMVRRLEELGSVKPGTWDWFQSNGGITDEQARQVLGDLSTPDAFKADAGRPTARRLNMLAAEAERQGLLSEGQLARLLQLDRVELREILNNHELEGSEGDGVINRLD